MLGIRLGYFLAKERISLNEVKQEKYLVESKSLSDVPICGMLYIARFLSSAGMCQRCQDYRHLDLLCYVSHGCDHVQVRRYIIVLGIHDQIRLFHNYCVQGHRDVRCNYSQNYTEEGD